MRTSVLIGLGLIVSTSAAAEEFSPAPADQIPGYSTTVLPCAVKAQLWTSKRETVACEGKVLETKSLRELSILRNTIFARYGWDGYRKEWLRAYFHRQPWFKPSRKFRYTALSEVDRQNVHLIATYEQTLSDAELADRRDALLTRYGKVWNDEPVFSFYDPETDERTKPDVKSCKVPVGATEDPIDDFDAMIARSRYCRALKIPGYKPDPAFSLEKLSQDDRVEMGLISRALGQFAIDDQKRAGLEQSLDALLEVKQLRQLSLRDLRLLRNTIFARHGRLFKSEILQKHFDGLSWYAKNAAYTDELLTETDKRNIKLIMSVEGEFGGALKDEDFLIDPSVDIA